MRPLYYRNLTLPPRFTMLESCPSTIDGEEEAIGEATRTVGRFDYWKCLTEADHG